MNVNYITFQWFTIGLFGKYIPRAGGQTLVYILHTLTNVVNNELSKNILPVLIRLGHPSMKMLNFRITVIENILQ